MRSEITDEQLLLLCCHLPVLFPELVALDLVLVGQGASCMKGVLLKRWISEKYQTKL
jgi:hypothetical protein